MQYAGSSDSPRPRTTGSQVTTPQGGGRTNLQCFYCGKQGHRKEDCRRRQRDEAQPAESRGSSRSAMMKQIRTQQGNKYPYPQDTPPSGIEYLPQHSTLPVPPSATSSTSQGERELDTPEQPPLGLLFSYSDGEGVKQVRVPDCGSCPHLARVDIHGVPADGIVDTVADITIMGGKLFALVAAAAKLRKRDFRKPDQVPRNYDGKDFHLDGCMEMDLMFQHIILATTVYVKMDAIDQLLLSEGVCRQLGIVSYHSSITAQEAKRRKGSSTVPSIRVRLVHFLKLLLSQSVLVPVRLNPHSVKDKALFNEGGPLLEEVGLILEDAVVATPCDGVTYVTIVNMSGLTQKLPEEFVVGEAHAAEVVTPRSYSPLYQKERGICCGANGLPHRRLLKFSR